MLKLQIGTILDRILFYAFTWWFKGGDSDSTVSVLGLVRKCLHPIRCFTLELNGNFCSMRLIVHLWNHLWWFCSAWWWLQCLWEKYNSNCWQLHWNSVLKSQSHGFNGPKWSLWIQQRNRLNYKYMHNVMRTFLSWWWFLHWINDIQSTLTLTQAHQIHTHTLHIIKL